MKLMSKLMGFYGQFEAARDSIIAAAVGAVVPIGKTGGVRVFGRSVTLNLTATVDK